MFPARTILDPIIAIAAGVLFIAYLRTEYLAPVPTEVATLKYPHEFGFPAWFSKGPSPNDVVEEDLVQTGDPEERILILHDHEDHDPATFVMVHYFEDLKADKILATVRTVQEHAAVEQEDETCPWSWILTIGGNAHGTGVSSGCDTVPVIQYGTKNPPNAAQLDLGTGVSLLDSSRFDQVAVTSSLYTKTHEQVGLIAFVLPAANPAVFWPENKPFATRRKQVTFFTSHETWTHKAQLEDRLPSGWRSVLIPTVDQHERLPAKVLRKLKHAEKTLAGEMRNSGVCVFDDWSTGILTELHSQAMLSGCVVATVTPTIQSDDLSDLFLIVQRPNGDATERAMFAAVNEALRTADHAELDRKALWGFIYARQKLTFAKRLSDIRLWVQGYREGQRGIMLPFGYKHVL